MSESATAAIIALVQVSSKLESVQCKHTATLTTSSRYTSESWSADDARRHLRGGAAEVLPVGVYLFPVPKSLSGARPQDSVACSSASRQYAILMRTQLCV